MKNLIKISPNIREIPPTGNMRVPGRIYANERLITSIMKDDALKQVMKVASLPGIQKYSYAMPDVHQGYGFPIGGVAAFDVESGIISPGGVGYDINCGVRFIRTNLFYPGIKDRMNYLVEQIFRTVPTGVGSRNAIKKLNVHELKKVLKNGAEWSIQNKFGKESDLQAIEDFGKLKEADPEKVSERALKRGSNQLGTLGSGNHFIEIGIVTNIFDENITEEFRLEKDQVVIIIHTGSRGLGHQICDDYVHEMLFESNKLDFELPDKQLASVYIQSKLGDDYFGAMACAANFAWANRQIMMHLIKKTMMRTLKIDESNLGFELIYDVCHNIAKFEEHEIEGKMRRVCIHRKGATRAFGPNRKELVSKFRETGQPVIIPGDMGTESYLCVATEKAMQETFGSSCHGAGRMMSRHQALKNADFPSLMDELNRKNIIVKAAKKKTLIEEKSDAYKNVTEVVQTMHDEGIIRKVVRTVPVGVIKG